MKTNKVCILLLLMMLFGTAHAMYGKIDTVYITLQEAEKQFFKKNLSLLIAKYNIDIATAQIIQSKLYANPNLQYTMDVYNPLNYKWLDLSNKYGEFAIQVNQLIILARKRYKSIQLAQTNKKINEQSYYDLIRTLRYQLRSDFYNAYFLQNSFNTYTKQIEYLTYLSDSYSKFAQQGIVTLKDAIRITSLLYSLKTEQTDFQNQLTVIQADMQLLLQDPHHHFIVIADPNTATNDSVSNLNLGNLMDTAFANRYDLQVALSNVQYSKQNLSYQKALAVPDLTLSSQYDRRGGFAINSTIVTATMDVPVFNRNQGGILAAKLGIDVNNLTLQQQETIVETDVHQAYQKLLFTDKSLRTFDTSFQNKFQEVLGDVGTSFQNRNISILDFTDFTESYKNNILQINNLKNAKMQAIEQLNFAVGKILF